jgi:hypothetical protein
MRTFVFSGHALSIGAVATLLAGCGGSQPPIGAGEVPKANRAQVAGISNDASSGDLLYVSEYAQGVVGAFTYPGGRLVQTLNVSGPWGLCSDSNGDVFIPALGSNEVLEYRHGGKAPVATLQTSGEAEACSVDPTTGNLAVLWFDTSGEAVSIFPNASGSPTSYWAPRGSVFWYCGYDDSGNLFIDGQSQSQPGAMWELPTGSTGFLTVDFTNTHFEGGTQVQWDGQYVTVEAAHTISRLTFSTQGVTQPGHINGTVVGVTTFENCLSYVYQSWIQGSELIVPCESIAHKYGVHGYGYPQGGKPGQHLLHAGKRLVGGPFYGATISVASDARARR